MSRSDLNLSETDIRPPGAEFSTVRVDATDSRDWLKNAPICPELAKYRIRHLGVAQMPSPFEIVRTKLGGSYFLACYGGEGRVLVDGRWTKCRPGHAVLLPPGTLQAFQTTPGRTWGFCWVRYQERAGQAPMTAAQTPVIARFDTDGLRLAILGLRHECQSLDQVNAAERKAIAHADPILIDRWVELIHHYVLRFAEPRCPDPRVFEIWDHVSSRLADPWTITEMARLVHLSEKQLQRLCLKELGRSPRQQLIWLRMRRAADLLMARDSKIESVAKQVGYQNPFVFSSTFKRVMGWSPSEYPGRK
jgi:AraC-like DNA-binding protein